MARIEREDIIGYNVGQELVCSKCLTQEEEDNVTLDSIVTDAEKDDTIFFCDRCKARL